MKTFHKHVQMALKMISNKEICFHMVNLMLIYDVYHNEERCTEVSLLRARGALIIHYLN